MKKIFFGFLDIIEFFVSTAAVAILIYLFITQPHQVNGSSMFPNFHDGEFLLTDKLTYRFREPQRGDVVVFSAPPAAHCPAGLNCDFIKRIVAIPGEQITLRNGHIYINGEKLTEPYLEDTVNTNPAANTSSFLKGEQEKTIPPDSYIVLGDNRSASSDSRVWGTVTGDKIVGRAWLRYWPPNAAGLINVQAATTE